MPAGPSKTSVTVPATGPSPAGVKKTPIRATPPSGAEAGRSAGSSVNGPSASPAVIVAAEARGLGNESSVREGTVEACRPRSRTGRGSGATKPPPPPPPQPSGEEQARRREHEAGEESDRDHRHLRELRPNAGPSTA